MNWFRSRRRRAPVATTIDAIVDRNVTIAWPFPTAQRDRLRDVTRRLIETKRWEAVDNVDLTDEVLVTVAANAAIPVLAIDFDVYKSVQAIIVRRTANVSARRRSGPVSGVVADDPISVVGLASPHTGPLSIAWTVALAESRRPETGRNVVIHEFAHKIDMRDGYQDGIPPLRGDDLRRWSDIVNDEYERAEARESDAALRPYAWASRAEFFAVATEAFFCTPITLAAAKPDLYGALAGFYRQNPATSATGSAPPS